MYLFHRGQHMALSYSNAELFFGLLFPLVDRLASFYRLILDTLVCWCVCVFILFHKLASSDCKTSVSYLRCSDQRSFVVSIARGMPNSFISISELMIFHLQRRNSSPPKNWKTISYTGILRKDIYWYWYRISDGHVPSRQVTKRYKR